MFEPFQHLLFILFSKTHLIYQVFVTAISLDTSGLVEDPNKSLSLLRTRMVALLIRVWSKMTRRSYYNAFTRSRNYRKYEFPTRKSHINDLSSRLFRPGNSETILIPSFRVVLNFQHGGGEERFCTESQLFFIFFFFK